jgi:hypothetical protein
MGGRTEIEKKLNTAGSVSGPGCEDGKTMNGMERKDDGGMMMMQTGGDVDELRKRRQQKKTRRQKNIAVVGGKPQTELANTAFRKAEKRYRYQADQDDAERDYSDVFDIQNIDKNSELNKSKMRSIPIQDSSFEAIFKGIFLLHFSTSTRPSFALHLLFLSLPPSSLSLITGEESAIHLSAFVTKPQQAFAIDGVDGLMILPNVFTVDQQLYWIRRSILHYTINNPTNLSNLAAGGTGGVEANSKSWSKLPEGGVDSQEMKGKRAAPCHNPFFFFFSFSFCKFSLLLSVFS